MEVPGTFVGGPKHGHHESVPDDLTQIEVRDHATGQRTLYRLKRWETERIGSGGSEYPIHHVFADTSLSNDEFESLYRALDPPADA